MLIYNDDISKTVSQKAYSQEKPVKVSTTKKNKSNVTKKKLTDQNSKFLKSLGFKLRK